MQRNVKQGKGTCDLRRHICLSGLKGFAIVDTVLIWGYFLLLSMQKQATIHSMPTA